MKQIKVNSPDALPAVAEELLGVLHGRTVVAFRGEMGAGKTTFIRAICCALGVHDTVTSPTFALVNEYKDRDGRPVYHFDFYRIDKPEEALDFGCEEYFDSGNLCLVEWPEKVESLLPDSGLVHVTIEVTGPDSRCITVETGPVQSEAGKSPHL